MGRNYINMYGSIKHCWRIHRRKMIEEGEAWVDYQGFHSRVSRGWDLYKAIHTPSKHKHTLLMRLYIILYRVEKIFRDLFSTEG